MGIPGNTCTRDTGSSPVAPDNMMQIDKNTEFYCESCGQYRPVTIDIISKEEPNYKPWSDIMCRSCNSIIATFQYEV